ncbi:MAG TPA: hypothetical protein VN260_02195, partial [Dissulfurispiraceae bacterium]|nr:hypothetical protein [Dissulfurispiraceae bacterium]
DLQVGLHSLSGPVDVYLAIHAPVLDPNTFFIIKPDNSVQPHTEGIVPWRSATEGPLSLSLYGPVPIEGLAAGTYYFYAVVLPHGAPGGYYLWQTSFTVP